MESNTLSNLKKLSTELAAQPDTWKQMTILEAVTTIEALQQENKQLQAQVAKMREAVEVLETVTEHLENCYGRNTPDTEKAREVLAAVDKMGGKEDV